MFFCVIMSIGRTIVASWLIKKLPFRAFYATFCNWIIN
jgi:hypothetical protein